MKVKIELFSMYKSVKILVEEDKLFVNGKQKDVDIEAFLRKLFVGIKRHKNLMKNFVIFKIFLN